MSATQGESPNERRTFSLLSLVVLEGSESASFDASMKAWLPVDSAVAMMMIDRMCNARSEEDGEITSKVIFWKESF